MILFKVAGTDYTSRILVPTYNVNAEDVGDKWVDGNHITHKDVYRKKVVGEFDMYFFENGDFENFTTLLSTAKRDNYIPIWVYVANEIAGREVNAFVTLAPKMTRYAHGAVRYDVFTVQIEER